MWGDLRNELRGCFLCRPCAPFKMAKDPRILLKFWFHWPMQLKHIIILTINISNFSSVKENLPSTAQGTNQCFKHRPTGLELTGEKPIFMYLITNVGDDSQTT